MRASDGCQQANTARNAQTIEETSEEEEESSKEDMSIPLGDIEKVLDVRETADGKEEYFVKFKGTGQTVTDAAAFSSALRRVNALTKQARQHSGWSLSLSKSTALSTSNGLE